MSGSATGLRERRIAATSAAVTAQARRWTAERGFGGFTVDELCASVEISRRTFFNYFSTKEDAVLGVPARANHHDAEASFLIAADERGPNGLSTTLLGDLAELLITRWERLGFGPGDVDAVVAAIESAPRLLGRALQLTREQEQDDIRLVERREGLEAGDLRAGTVVHLLGSILRGAVEETFAGPDREPLRAVFSRRLAVARSVFAS